MTSCHRPIGLFKIRRAYSLIPLTPFILAYYLFLIFDKQKQQPAQLVTGYVHIASGPGFESQVPQIFHVFFLFRFRCAPRTKVHHVTSQSSLPSVLRPDPRAITGGIPKARSKQSHWIQEVNVDFHLWAQNSDFCTPHNCFCRPNFLSLFLFYILLIYLFYLLTKN